MADGVFFDITGADLLQAKLKGLSDEVGLKAANTAARKAAQLVARAAYANALRLDDPATGEQIAKNIWDGGSKYPGVRKRGKRTLEEGATGYRVGVAGGARAYANTSANRRKGRVGKKYETLGDKSNPGGDTFYWRFLELGTEKIAATPFLRPAMESNQQRATEVFVEEFNAAIDRVIARAQKRAAQRSGFQTARRNLAGLD